LNGLVHPAQTQVVAYDATAPFKKPIKRKNRRVEWKCFVKSIGKRFFRFGKTPTHFLRSQRLFSIFCVAALTGFVSLLATQNALAIDYTVRSGGPASDEMLEKGQNGGVDGLAFFRAVLTGVLYRGGFTQGDQQRSGLSSSQRESLCRASFSGAFYVDFGSHTEYGQTKCESRTLDYRWAGSTRTKNVMEAIYEVIKNPDFGPLYVHCMWGVHWSGAVAAMALIQFCGWSQEKAKAYWDATRNDAPCSGGCSKWIDSKFARFRVDAQLNISREEKKAICPR
jgi:hypothetical protein